jgi:hypothetical protein
LKVPVEELFKLYKDTLKNLKAEFSYNFTVVESFDEPDGKFGDNLGNVALIDCRYLGQIFG